MNTHERQLHDYEAEVPEHDELRKGMPNAGVDAVDFRLPGEQEVGWHVAFETSQDDAAPGKESLWKDPANYRMASRCSAIFVARKRSRT